MFQKNQKYKISVSIDSTNRIEFANLLTSRLLDEQIRSYYDSLNDNRKVLIVNEKDKSVGIIKIGISEKVLRILGNEKLTLVYARPAKGNGYFMLSFEGETNELLFSKNGFNENVLQNYGKLQNDISETFGIEQLIIDNGYDC